MTLILFEDELVDQLRPITLARPAFAVSCGSLRLFDLIAELGLGVQCVVRPHLSEITRQDFPEQKPERSSSDGITALVNARLVPSVSVVRRINEMVSAGQPGIVHSGPSIAAAVLTKGSPHLSNGVTTGQLSQIVEELKLPRLDADLPLFEYPHDVLRHHLMSLPENLSHRLEIGGYSEVAQNVFVASGAKLAEPISTDTQRGPIVIEDGAVIEPFCYLRGPLHIGRNARIVEHSAVKDSVTLGHTTKIGGEVEASIIEPYSNKQHHGFLGHSYLGSWINLGAGTSNSDLKNTYGNVNMDYRGRKVPTGMQFVGCFVGDYSKTAINTGIFTGKTIGVCSMVYGFVTTNVPSFVNYARLFGQVTEAGPDVAISAQARMFARRKVTQRECDIQLLRDLFELTRDERDSGEPLHEGPLHL